MSPRPRLCSGAEAVRKFKRAGWSVARQVGSHVMMVKPDYLYTLSIPQHIKQANLSVQRFNDL